MNWKEFNRIIALRQEGRVEESILELEKISKEEDNLTRAVILMEIVNGLRLLGCYQEAHRKINEACALLGPGHQQYPEAAFLAAAIDMDAGNWKRGLARLDAILDKHGSILSSPSNKDLLDEIQRNRGIAFTNLKKFAKAVPLLESVRAVEHGRQQTLCYLGMCAFELKDFPAAREVFQELLSLEPGSAFRAYAHYYLGIMYFSENQFARAKAQFESSFACPDRWKLSEANLLEWLINTCKALNLDHESEHYSLSLRNVRKLRGSGRPGKRG